LICKAEYRQARQQQVELQRSQQFLDSLLNPSQTQKESQPTSLNPDASKGKTAGKDLKARFATPPNPPPQVPLPEKPHESPNISLLRRGDTERPKLPNGPISPPTQSDSLSPQDSGLSEALNAAKKDLEEQSIKLRDLQDLLVKERVRRVDAEARASQLERERTVGAVLPQNGSLIQPKEDDDPTLTPIEDDPNSEIGKKKAEPAPADESATEKLQRRLDLLLLEFHEVKESSERWRLEKEEAHRQLDEERKEKLSLMEMIEAQRKIERERTEKKNRPRSLRWRNSNDKRRAIANTDGASSPTEADDADDVSDNENIDDRRDSNSTPSPGSPRNLSFSSNGHVDSSLIHHDGKSTIMHMDRHQLAQAAPYLSAMSVVLLGVAVMALVNKMSRGER
jgi:hypothetical protein